MLVSENVRRVRAEAAEAALPLYAMPLTRRVDAVAYAMRARLGTALTTAKSRADNAYVDITLTVRGGATRGIERVDHAFCEELALATLNAGLVGWRRRVGHNLEVRYTTKRHLADRAREAAAARARRRRLNDNLGTVLALTICWITATTCLNAIYSPSRESLRLAASWIVTTLAFGAVSLLLHKR